MLHERDSYIDVIWQQKTRQDGNEVECKKEIPRDLRTQRSRQP